MMDRDWELIKVLYQEKNITKASKKLYISQPAVTKRLQMIERELDTKIVERGRKGVHFTPQGEYLVGCAEEMIEHMRRIRVDISNMTDEVKGSLKIGASNNFARKTLPKILSTYQDEYPNVKIEIITGWSGEIFKLLCNKEVDIAFIRGDYKWGEGERDLFEESLYIVNNKEISTDELKEAKRIEYNCDIKLKAAFDNWWRENFNSSLKNTMKVDRSDTCKEMVMQGLGYALLPSSVLKESDGLFKMELVNKKGKEIKRKTKLFCYNELETTAFGKKFLEVLDKTEINI